MPSVDVLIVSFNVRDALRDCLISLERHRPPARTSLRVSVIDNASTDGSAEMVADLFPQVRLLRSSQNLGFAAGNNALARASDADYLLLLNPDTVLVEDVVTPLMDVLEACDEAALAGPRLTYPDGTVQLSSQAFPTLRFELALALCHTKLGAFRPFWDSSRIINDVHQEALSHRREPRETEFIWATCWLVKRRVLNRVGLFDEDFGTYDEDLDLCLRLHHASLKAVYVPAVRLVHLGGASSTPEAKRVLERSARKHFYSKHRGSAYVWSLEVALAVVRMLKRFNAT